MRSGSERFLEKGNRSRKRLTAGFRKSSTARQGRCGERWFFTGGGNLGEGSPPSCSNRQANPFYGRTATRNELKGARRRPWRHGGAVTGCMAELFGGEVS